MIRKYRKKSIVIEAVQFDGTNEEEIETFTNNIARTLATQTPLIKISTLEGEMSARTGDWIIKGIKGEFYPCKPDIFAMTYAKVEEDNDKHLSSDPHDEMARASPSSNIHKAWNNR